MKEESYKRVVNLLSDSPYWRKTINAINNICTGAVYFIYPILLILLIYKGHSLANRFILGPGLSFILVSIFRKLKNAPRPYEIMDIVPVIPKDKKGNSFPSRHVFSAFVIGTNIFYILPGLGIFVLVLGTIIAIIRVVGGVHFIKDVVVGAIVGIIAGVVGMTI